MVVREGLALLETSIDFFNVPLYVA